MDLQFVAIRTTRSSLSTIESFPNQIDQRTRAKSGLVIAGTGLGHINKPLYAAVGRAIEKGMTVVMTVQTIWGYAQMYVYDTGRDLLKLGIIPMDNMLTETAYMKLAWVLGQTDDPARIREMLLTPVNHEVTSREPHNGYLVLQGGLPEVDAFVGQHWK